MAERISGKVEAIIAGAILVIVLVLFVKYYEPSNNPATQANDGKPAATEKATQ
jgi:hypothetical protein